MPDPLWYVCCDVVAHEGDFFELEVFDDDDLPCVEPCEWYQVCGCTTDELLGRVSLSATDSGFWTEPFGALPPTSVTVQVTHISAPPSPPPPLPPPPPPPLPPVPPLMPPPPYTCGCGWTSLYACPGSPAPVLR